jgi:hypothetical protein
MFLDLTQLESLVSTNQMLEHKIKKINMKKYSSNNKK